MRPYLRVFERFRRARVPYLTVGAFGISLYAERAGMVVTTADCDIMLPPDPRVLGRAIRVLRREGWRIEVGDEPLVRESEDVLRGIVSARAAVRALKGGLQIDLPLEIAGFPFDLLRKNKRRFRIGNVRVDVAALEDMVRSKELTNRPKDRLFLETFRAALREMGAKEGRGRGGRRKRRP